MIYVMSQKFLGKNIEKMVKHADYFILDGENYAVTGKSSDKEVAVATKYSRSQTVGNFCPEIKLYELLRKKKRGDEINEDKLVKEVKTFLGDKSFVAACNTAFKACVVGGPASKVNIFVVLPNVVYKYLGGKIVKRMKKLIDAEFDFIFTQDDIKDDKNILKKSLSESNMKYINRRALKIDRKYELKDLADMNDD